MMGTSNELREGSSSAGGAVVAQSSRPFSTHPLRARRIDGFGQVVADRSGRFALAPSAWEISTADTNDACIEKLRRIGFGTSPDDNLEQLSYRARIVARQARPSQIDYLILVPTLRCDLACNYCQVSRVDERARGFDWSEETLLAVEQMIDSVKSDHIKIEFQGGEPTLRLDLIERIIARCDRFASKSFVICTNLSSLSPELMVLLDRDDVFVSTSLDGDDVRHQRQRTQSDDATDRFLKNLATIVREFGPEKVSALPTIDQTNPPEPDDLIAAYTRFGQSSIYLRPINFQGFARKRHQDSKDGHASWWEYHARFVQRLIALNFADRSRVFEESYFSLCLRRIFRIGLDRHVDLRNPNPMGIDYVVVDYDGSIYPTDEARMLTRSGVIDLAIGDVKVGIDAAKRDILNSHSSMNGDPSCEQCPYQAFCGRDIIDDLSRYGRIDLPREETFFCQRHLAMFDLAMQLIFSGDPATQYSLAKWLGLAGDRLPKLPRL